MNETNDAPDDLVSIATIVMAVALAITLSACVIGVSEAVWPYLMAAFEAARFAP